MLMNDSILEHIRAIAPYQPGKPIPELAREMGMPDSEIIKLASNENPLGASPRALATLGQAHADSARYPDSNGFVLKAALAAKYGVTADQIVLGNGSNEVLELAARVFLSPGVSAVYSQYAFTVYPLAIQSSGARGIKVPARDFGHDPEAMLEAICESTRVMFIANPNNPTGTLLDSETLLALIKRVPSSVLVILDEAYAEYLPTDIGFDSIGWLKRFPNLVVTRTFSKAYGLAGLRVGFALAHPDVADMMNRVRQPFNVNSLAQHAAVAALHDDAFLARSIEVNRAGMAQLTDGFKRLGISYIPGFGNFLCFRIGDAEAMYQHLLGSGVIVRPVTNYGMPEYLRVSIGLEAENARFLLALEQGPREECQ